MSSPRLVMYELVSSVNASNPYFSPHTIKARLSFIHKGVPFETKEVTFREIRTTLAERLGKRGTVPVLEFEDGSLIQDSLEIAHWLEKTYPNAPSIFMPEATTPVDLNSSEYLAAVDAAVKLSTDFAMIPGCFPPIGGLAAPVIRERLSQLPAGDSDADYFVTDAKFGFPNAWAAVEKAAADPDTLVKNVKICIQELEDILQEQDFLTSRSRAGFGDFGVFGKFVMLHGVRPDLANELFMHGKVGSWVERIIQTYKLEAFMARKW